MRSIFGIALLATALGSHASIFAQQIAPAALNSTASKGNVILTSLFKPEYPPLARQANIAGEVDVTVTVHQDGTVEAAVLSGHPMLKQAALDSAAKSRFECRICSSPLSYLLVYTFRQTVEGDCCSSFSVPAQVEQEPQSSSAQGQPQTRISIVAEQICLCDPASVLARKVRSAKCLYLWKCSSR